MTIRQAKQTDITAIWALYKAVVAIPGGIIRVAEEVTEAYIRHFTEKSLENGLILVAEDEEVGIVGEIHAYPYGLFAFRHILTDLTIVVHPEHQSKKIGKILFETFLIQVSERFPHILRVELFVRENNEKAIAFYKKLGFREEGHHTHKIKNADNRLETPIHMAWLNDRYIGS
jgi:ribosomal protein S18 acetylase RimI-like enzyme